LLNTKKRSRIHKCNWRDIIRKCKKFLDVVYQVAILYLIYSLPQVFYSSFVQGVKYAQSETSPHDAHYTITSMEIFDWVIQIAPALLIKFSNAW